MKYIDISQTIANRMKKYPSDPPIKIRQFKSLKKGNSCNLNKLTFGSHTGTHIDAPRHIFRKANTIDNMKIKDLICDVLVTNINGFSKGRLFKNKPNSIKGILFKSKNNKVGLTINEANMLVKNKIKLIGTELMSIERAPNKSHPVHKLLLKNNVIIIESLDLEKIKPGYYKLICLPLKIKRGDGAPARAILVYD